LLLLELLLCWYNLCLCWLLWFQGQLLLLLRGRFVAASPDLLLLLGGGTADSKASTRLHAWN
jgi:uncharacterized SAM-binding protein YcdF (DUF218 family)